MTTTIAEDEFGAEKPFHYYCEFCSGDLFRAGPEGLHCATFTCCGYVQFKNYDRARRAAGCAGSPWGPVYN